MPSQDPHELDDIINRLLEVKNGRPGKQVLLTENEIRSLCTTAREIFTHQPNLLELEAPIKICGASPHGLRRVAIAHCTHASLLGLPSGLEDGRPWRRLAMPEILSAIARLSARAWLAGCDVAPVHTVRPVPRGLSASGA